MLFQRIVRAGLIKHLNNNNNLSTMAQIKIGPSILNANLANLAAESKHLLECGADYLHLDVMDGHFVPNLTFGHSTIACLRRELGPKPTFDCHMMVSEPLRWIEPMADAGCNYYTYHFESTNNQEQVIRKIREANLKVGLAIKPKTKVECVLPYINTIDMLLIMTVEPGFGGQKFMSDMMGKVEYLRKAYHELDIEVDGGVGPETVKECCSAGANRIVSGTAITKSKEPKIMIEKLRNIAEANYCKSLP